MLGLWDLNLKLWLFPWQPQPSSTPFTKPSLQALTWHMGCQEQARDTGSTGGTWGGAVGDGQDSLPLLSLCPWAPPSSGYTTAALCSCVHMCACAAYVCVCVCGTGGDMFISVSMGWVQWVRAFLESCVYFLF